MANFTDKLVLLIQADSKDAVRELRKVGSVSEESFGKARKSGSSLKDQLISSGGIQTAATAAATAFAAFGVSAVKAAAEGEVSQARLGAAIRATGGDLNQYRGRIDNVANKMARFGFENDEVEASITRLLPVTKDVGKAIDLQGTAADIAAARGISLADATNILVKAQGGQAGQLVRLGILTKAQAKDLKDGDAIVRQLAQTYSGQAAAAADTFTGKLKALQAQSANLKEEIGNLLLPVLTDYATLVESIASRGQSFIAWAQDSTDSLGTFGDVLGTAKDSLLSFATGGVSEYIRIGGLLGDTTDAVKTKTDELSAAQSDLAQKVAGGKASEEELAAARSRVAAASEDVKVITDAVTGATQESTEATEEAVDWTKKHKEELAKFSDKIKEADQRLRDYTDAVTGTRDAQREQVLANLDANDAITEYNKAVKESGAQSEAAVRAYFGATEAVEDVGLAAVKTAEQQAKLTGKTITAEEKIKIQKKAYEDFARTLDENSPLRAHIRGLINDLDNAARPRTANFTVKIETRTTGERSAGGGGRQVRAAGGPVEAGREYLVGERGPELFKPDRDGQIVPNHALRNSRAATLGGGTSANVNIYVNAVIPPGADAGAFVRNVTRELESGHGKTELKRALGI